MKNTTVPYFKTQVSNMIETINKELGEILNSIQDGVIAINRDGKITIINDSAERITGVKPVP